MLNRRRFIASLTLSSLSLAVNCAFAQTAPKNNKLIVFLLVRQHTLHCQYPKAKNGSRPL